MDQMSLAGLGLGVVSGQGVRGLGRGFLALDQLRRTVQATLHLNALFSSR